MTTILIRITDGDDVTETEATLPLTQAHELRLIQDFYRIRSGGKVFPLAEVVPGLISLGCDQFLLTYAKSNLRLLLDPIK